MFSALLEFNSFLIKKGSHCSTAKEHTHTHHHGLLALTPPGSLRLVFFSSKLHCVRASFWRVMAVNSIYIWAVVKKRPLLRQWWILLFKKNYWSISKNGRFTFTKFNLFPQHTLEFFLWWWIPTMCHFQIGRARLFFSVCAIVLIAHQKYA